MEKKHHFATSDSILDEKLLSTLADKYGLCKLQAGVELFHGTIDKNWDGTNPRENTFFALSLDRAGYGGYKENDRHFKYKVIKELRLLMAWKLSMKNISSCLAEILTDCGMPHRDRVDGLDLYKNPETFTKLTQVLISQGFDGLITCSEKVNWGDVILFQPKNCVELDEELANSTKQTTLKHIKEIEKHLNKARRGEELFNFEPSSDDMAILTIPGLQCNYGSLWSRDEIIKNSYVKMDIGLDIAWSDNDLRTQLKEILCKLKGGALIYPTKRCWQDVQYLKKMYNQSVNE